MMSFEERMEMIKKQRESTGKPTCHPLPGFMIALVMCEGILDSSKTIEEAKIKLQQEKEINLALTKKPEGYLYQDLKI
jgi:hypothetical protein